MLVREHPRAQEDDGGRREGARARAGAPATAARHAVAVPAEAVHVLHAAAAPVAVSLLVYVVHERNLPCPAPASSISVIRRPIRSQLYLGTVAGAGADGAAAHACDVRRRATAPLLSRPLCLYRR